MYRPGDRTASISLHFIVVGGGIGGLSTAYCLNQGGHKVTIVDPSDLTAEIGAGIQLSPNVTRLLYRWGLESQLESHCAKPKEAFRCSYDTDDQTIFLKFSNQPSDGAKFYGIYRPDLAKMLYDLVKDKVNFIKGKVASVDPEMLSVTLGNGEVLTADVIIGADGVGSIVRPVVVPAPDKPVVSGLACYRALIQVDEIRKHPELSSISVDDMQFWEGPDKRIIAYGVGQGFYNLVLHVPDSDLGGQWARKLVSLIKSAIKFKLIMRTPTDTWVHPNGRIALLGDAAHAMLPYYAQGAAMAIEDAAVLGNLFSRISSHEEIREFLLTYQTMRSPRSNATHAISLGNTNPNIVADAWRTLEGQDSTVPEFVRKAQALKEASKRPEVKIFQKQYEYDADKEVDNWWTSNRPQLG